MTPDKISDSAVYAAAAILLVAIVAKLVAANLISRIKQDFRLMDHARKEVLGKLKQAQLAAISARGTQEFWRRRFTEITQKVEDATRDLEAYQKQLGSPDSETAADLGEDEGGFGEEFELAAAVSEMAEGFITTQDRDARDHDTQDHDTGQSGGFVDDSDAAGEVPGDVDADHEAAPSSWVDDGGVTESDKPEDSSEQTDA